MERWTYVEEDTFDDGKGDVTGQHTWTATFCSTLTGTEGQSRPVFPCSNRRASVMQPYHTSISVNVSYKRKTHLSQCGTSRMVVGGG